MSHAAFPAPDAAFMIGTTVPTVVAVRRCAVQPPTGSDQRRADLAGRRRASRQQLRPRRRADHRHAQSRSAHPSIESLDDVKVQVHTYDAEMGRTGGGVFNTTLKSGTQLVPRQRVHPGPTDLGPDQQLLQSRNRGRAEAGKPVSARRRRASAARSSRTGPSSGSPPRTTSTRRRATSANSCPPPLERAGDFSRLRRTRRGSRSPSTTRSPISRSPATASRRTGSTRWRPRC